MTTAKRRAVKRVTKSGSKSGRAATQFKPGADNRRGKGPAKNAPNAGRPPSAIREAYRLAAADRLQFLCDVIDGKVLTRLKIGDTETCTEVSAEIPDRLRAWDMLNKYGIGTTTTVTDSDGKDAPQTGVLAVPMPIGAVQWGIAAAAQQAALAARNTPADGE